MQGKVCVGWPLGNENAEGVGESGGKEEGEEEVVRKMKKAEAETKARCRTGVILPWCTQTKPSSSRLTP
jgi:hypothetical protein